MRIPVLQFPAPARRHSSRERRPGRAARGIVAALVLAFAFAVGAFRKSPFLPSLDASAPAAKRDDLGVLGGQKEEPSSPPPVPPSELVALHESMVRHYESRVGAGLPRVTENFPDLQWANFNIWAVGRENRSHFRSHYPLYTLQTLWDHADRHYQVLGGPSPATSYDKGLLQPVRDGEVVFVNQVWRSWLGEVAPHIRANNITIILFDGDSRFCNDEQATKLKEMPNIKRIFATNACPHPKVIPLPLGIEDNIEFPTTFKDWTFHGDELKLSRFLSSQAKIAEKSGVFCDMNVATNPRIRRPALEFCMRLEKDPSAGVEVELGSMAKNSGRKTWETYLTDLARHRFVISPEGNGFDCHRTWEALLVGSIPVVQHNDGMGDGVYEGLPVLIVKSWSNITADLLEAEWATFANAPAGTYQYDKLFAPYWIDIIRGTSTSNFTQAVATVPRHAMSRPLLDNGQKAIRGNIKRSTSPN